ncbi:MAG: XdhC family protein [Dehalococcoidales bacterium]|nr:XdhC family protein [Dehalococcoidales bacterium]
MNSTKYLSDIIAGQIETGSAVVLASIVSMEGSTPRESGSKMVVASGGRSYGTIGGGLMEATTIQESVNVLSDKKSKFIEIDMTGSDTSSPDMICGGETVILLDYIEAVEGNLAIFREMSNLIENGDSFYLVTGYTGSGESIAVEGHCLLFSHGETIGDAIITGRAIPVIREELHNISSTMTLTIGDRQYIIDPVRREKTVYCFGAGHVAVPTAHIAALAGFRVVVLDDRDEFANRERFPDADDVIVLDDYNRALEGLEIDEDSYIVILTRGHRYDREVLEQSLVTDAEYIGMISSRKKRDDVYRRLIADGVTTADVLEKVHSPIGLPIGGETPEEIAVSIVAEMISVREKKE